MQTCQIEISKLYGLDGTATLDAFTFGTFRDDDVMDKRPAIVVVPGGGYAMVSKREGEPIAAYFMGKGYNAFVLTYSVRPQAYYPAQLLQLCASVDYIRKHANELHVDLDRIYVVGFSAGGHLVGNFATDYMNVNEKFGKNWDLAATAAGLCYPVISAEYSVGSFLNLLADRTEAEKETLAESIALDKNVTAGTLPSFVWTTAEDKVVSPINSIRYIEACLACGVKCELHMFSSGWHGLSTCDELTNDFQPFMTRLQNWLPLCETFFSSIVK